jgi:hypothetical protein
MNETKKDQNKIVKDIPRLENDIYRVMAWLGKEGIPFISLQVFFKKNGSYKKTKEAVHLSASLRQVVTKALLVAKNDSELPVPQEKKFEARFITSVPVSEEGVFQISKVRGSKNSAVRISYAGRNEKGEFVPSPKRSLSILESSVEGVTDALMSPEMDQAVTELEKAA